MASLNSNTRVTASDVSEIFETDLTNSELHNHINVAAERVDEIAAADSSVADQRLALIEQYLAAHVATVQDPRASKEDHESFAVTYQRTTYGQTAVELDPTGTLAGDTDGSDVEFFVPDTKGIRR